MGWLRRPLRGNWITPAPVGYRRAVIPSLVGACALIGLAACGQGLPAEGTHPGPPRSPQSALEIPRAPYDVVPAELADPRILDRIPHRALIKRWGLAWLVRDGAPIGSNTKSDASSAEMIHVIGEYARKIRIVMEDDKARYAVWVAREDAADTVLVPIALADERGIELPVWLEPGVRLDAAPKAGALRDVQIVDPMLAVAGWARTGAIGQIWVSHADPKTRWRNPPHGTETLVRLGQGAELRAAADPKARVIATVKADELVVRRVAARGAYTEVAADRPFVKVRGFIETTKVLGETDDFVSFGSGSGHGFGMSHAVHHEIPAGTCLYDHSEGDVIGVTLEAETRLGGKLGDDGWAMIYIDSPWGVSSMYAKNLVRDPSQPPSWDSCTEPAHRR
jgi:hypothetical protein